jgi:hypothetical protein
MTEKEITNLGFKKVKVTAEESGAAKFYYYVYKVGSIEFLTNADTDVEQGNNWCVEMLEGGILFHRIKELKLVIELMELNKKV